MCNVVQIVNLNFSLGLQEHTENKLKSPSFMMRVYIVLYCNVNGGWSDTTDLSGLISPRLRLSFCLHFYIYVIRVTDIYLTSLLFEEKDVLYTVSLKDYVITFTVFTI